MSDIYKDPVLKKYVDLITGVFGEGTFKEYYYGDPIKIPMSNLPALIIAKDETRAGNAIDGGTNVDDVHQMAITITVVTDMRAEINDDKTIAAGTAKLYDIMEGRDPTTLKLKTKTILDVLRGNLLVDSALGLRTDLGTPTRIDYGMTLGKREEEVWAIEAQLEFVAHFTQVR